MKITPRGGLMDNDIQVTVTNAASNGMNDGAGLAPPAPDFGPEAAAVTDQGTNEYYQDKIKDHMNRIAQSKDFIEKEYNMMENQADKEEDIKYESYQDRARDLMEKRRTNKGEMDRSEDTSLLDEAFTKKYRSLVARANYIVPERPDIGFSVKEIARAMANPTQEDWEQLCRLARYLVGRPRLRINFRFQPEPEYIQACSDSDWAGCRKTRRSTSGGIVLYGSHLIRAYSRTQATVALSSAEAELYATVRASAEYIGIASMLKDFGVTKKGYLLGDASAALGIIRRRGIGKMRHIDTSYLWVQERAANKDIMYDKISGKDNPADGQTKHVSKELIDQYAEYCDYEFPKEKNEFGYTIDNQGDAESKNMDYIGGNTKVHINFSNEVVHAFDSHVERHLCELANQSGISGMKIWSRHDLGTCTYRSTNKTGPHWQQVHGRVTVRCCNGKVLDSILLEDLTANMEHGKLPCGKADTVTYLLYSDTTWRTGRRAKFEGA